ncbi:DUF3515 domain-containing protein [Dietzia sp. B32]|uniref:DUF3515 domain-containing protein n=1 Tax=Dietzia sp. B32 TaxID=2915130 RepID=UPI0021AE015C|nr:DUF3515 domain-containing protein [Dietzia sp. B32]UVE95673.1 DUF3515 domain-containing protein [Dietzia sp. B32]
MASTDADPGNRYDAGPRETGDPAARTVPVSRIVVVLAVVIPLIMLAVVLVMVRSVGDEASEAAASEPVAAVPIPSPGAGSEECAALVEALPEALGDAGRVALVEPAPEGTAAYRMPDAEPVIVRCGLPAPPTFTVGVGLQEVNGVQWFNEPDPDPAVTASTWVAVDRPQFVAVTLPEGSGTGPIQDLSAALVETFEAVEPDPAPVG